MGGNKRITPEKRKGKDHEESVANWLQTVIDTLAFEYGWSKAEIFDMFPREIEILVEEARKRQARESDMRQYQLAIAACVPHMKDGGKQFIRDLINKYRRFDDGSEVTKEQIDRDTEIAKRVLGM